MATSLVSPASSECSFAQRHKKSRRFEISFVTALTFAALLVHGYHPYAEDGGVYMPEIKRMVDPSLYPHGSAFVVGHLPYSLFAPMIAGLARLTHWSVETVLFIAYLASFWMTLFSASLLASRCNRSREARCGAVALLAAWITLPIAGTSLMLMDPYVTARSIATPFALLALVGALDFMLTLPLGDSGTERGVKGVILCCVSLAVAAAMHPLMGAYAVGSVLLLAILMWPSPAVRIWGMGAVTFATIATAAGIVLSAPSESAVYKQIVMTRYYWFVGQWRWYEVFGLIAPLLILGFAAWRHRNATNAAQLGLVRMALAAGLLAGVTAILFARSAMDTHAVARLQPLRIFQLVYIVMILQLGAAMAERLLRHKKWRWAITYSLLGMVMIAAERTTFSASKHIEIPQEMRASSATGTSNLWEEAFVWIRGNTPKDAKFALNAHYISKPGEDAQGFRAIAERSVLPDFSKDGGVVTNKPELAQLWLQGQETQSMLDIESDSQRAAALEPLGVTWVILPRGTATHFSCSYMNAAIKVCRLPSSANSTNVASFTQSASHASSADSAPYADDNGAAVPLSR